MPRQHLTPLERPGTHCTEGWVGLRAGLDWCGKSRLTGIRSPDRPAPRQSLYRLRYPAHRVQFLSSLKSTLYTAVTRPQQSRNYASQVRINSHAQDTTALHPTLILIEIFRHKLLTA